MKRWLVPLLHKLGAIVAFFTVLIGCWSLGYWLLPMLLHVAGWNPNVYVQQILNLLLGLFIMYVLVGLMFLITNRRRHDIGRPLLEAMERIAKGDFSVKLDWNKRDSGPFRESNPLDDIAFGFNNMVMELGQLEQMRQEFVSNVSHEIQSPLTSIRGFARVLRNDELNKEERLRYLGIIESESLRLSKLSDNLLRLASLETGRHPIESRTYRLDRQLSRLILTCEPQWNEKKQQMTVQLEECAMEGDEELLSQVWMNLIHNAIKFTPSGGSIDITLVCRQDKAEFRIADNGIGIEESRHQLIFGRFYKVEKARTREAGGSGLGLSLVQKIVRLHEGTIQVESELGRGAAFTVFLPLKQHSSQSSVHV